MPDKNQVYIYNDVQLSLIKNTFADNEHLIYAVRKALLQFELNEADRTLLKQALTPEVVEVLKIRLLPDIGNAFPLTQIPSILTTLTNELKVKDVDEMSLQFQAKKLEIAYLQQQFDYLEELAGRGKKEKATQISLSSMAVITGDALEDYINMTAYLFLLGYIDPMLLMIKTIAGTKEESIEDTKKRMFRDSSK